MRSKQAFLAFAASTVLLTVTAKASGIDMDDPRRALGREDNVRIDAQLLHDTVSPGAAIGVTYQIQNFTSSTVAVADKVSDATYDEDSRTITFSIGSEVPGDVLPHMVMIAPGERKVFRTAATPSLTVAATREAFAIVPRYVQVKVTILRNLAPFLALIENQARGRQRLSNELFDRWLESSDTIFLNSLPVGWMPRSSNGTADASQRNARGGF